MPALHAVTLLASIAARGLLGHPADAPDCGSAALYLLLQLEGRPTDLEGLRRRLGQPGPRGHSLAELRRVSHELGVRLEGRLVDLERGPLGGPALAYLRQPNGHGHFLVVRPVGHTGTLVQVLDGSSRPGLVDRSELADWRGWTGIVLSRPAGGGWLTALGVLLLATAAVGLARSALARQRRSSAAPA